MENKSALSFIVQAECNSSKARTGLMKLPHYNVKTPVFMPVGTQRFGCALVNKGQLNLKQKKYQTDLQPIDKNCTCSTCKTYTRAYLHCIVSVETVACHLISVHNIAFQMRLMKSMRDNIEKGTFPEFVKNFMSEVYSSEQYPHWIIQSLASVGINICEK